MIEAGFAATPPPELPETEPLEVVLLGAAPELGPLEVKLLEAALLVALSVGSPEVVPEAASPGALPVLPGVVLEPPGVEPLGALLLPEPEPLKLLGVSLVPKLVSKLELPLEPLGALLLPELELP